MIYVDQLCKAYRHTLAVDHVSFAVQPGEILGLVGRNGAGKTTTIRSLAGIIPPSQGEIRINGYSISSHPIEAKQQLAYIPDEPQLFDALTIREHLAFIEMAYQLGPCRDRMAQLLHEFDLTTKANAPAEELSRGMRQKLQICCAYLHNPRVILFDEPMVGLDPHGIRQLKASMVAQAAGGAALLISSHMLAMVEDICTHVLILDQGSTRFCGKVEAMREAFGAESGRSSLEDAFFRATDRVAAEDSATANMLTTTA